MQCQLAVPFVVSVKSRAPCRAFLRCFVCKKCAMAWAGPTPEFCAMLFLTDNSTAWQTDDTTARSPRQQYFMKNQPKIVYQDFRNPPRGVRANPCLLPAGQLLLFETVTKETGELRTCAYDPFSGCRTQLQTFIAFEQGLQVRPVRFVHIVEGVQIYGHRFPRILRQQSVDGRF